MKTRKQQYIDQMRSNTAYSTYRAFARILKILGYVLAGIFLVAGVVDYFTRGQDTAFLQGGRFLLGCIIVAVITVFVSQVSKETALILADIADSITDANSKSSYEQ